MCAPFSLDEIEISSSRSVDLRHVVKQRVAYGYETGIAMNDIKDIFQIRLCCLGLNDGNSNYSSSNNNYC